MKKLYTKPEVDITVISEDVMTLISGGTQTIGASSTTDLNSVKINFS